MSNRIIITAKCHPFLIEQLLEKGFEIFQNPTINYSELLIEIKNCIGLITTTSIIIDKNILDHANELKWIGRLGSGMEHIDVDYATSKGIRCESSPEGNCNAVAEHCLGLLLNLTNNIQKSYAEIKHGNWNREENRGTEIFGKTIGIIGFGNTGSSFAKLLEPFKVTALANDINKKNISNHYILQSSIEQIYNEADVVSLHLPLTEITYQYANDIFFSSFKKEIYFLNTCRGEVVNTDALIKALTNKKIKAAAIDVLENEKFETYSEIEKQQINYLLNNKNVIITPHIAGYSFEASLKMAKIILEKLQL